MGQVNTKFLSQSPACWIAAHQIQANYLQAWGQGWHITHHLTLLLSEKTAEQRIIAYLELPKSKEKKNRSHIKSRFKWVYIFFHFGTLSPHLLRWSWWQQVTPCCVSSPWQCRVTGEHQPLASPAEGSSTHEILVSSNAWLPPHASL